MRAAATLGSADSAVAEALRAGMARRDAATLRRRYTEQGAFLHLQNFLPAATTEMLAAAAGALEPAMNRNYLPGHKQGGSVGRHSIDRLAPEIAELYRSAPLREWCSEVAGESLQVAPADDAHAYALYYYTRRGDHIGWHYDTSYYAGRRYTVLLGVLDRSSCRLEYELHTRDAGAAVVAGSLQLAPGGVVFFDGDRLRHRITPLGAGERRVSLSLEYVTDPTMPARWRVISQMKDAIAYFGFREVFRRSIRGHAGRG